MLSWFMSVIMQVEVTPPCNMVSTLTGLLSTYVEIDWLVCHWSHTRNVEGVRGMQLHCALRAGLALSIRCSQTLNHRCWVLYWISRYWIEWSYGHVCFVLGLRKMWQCKGCFHLYMSWWSMIVMANKRANRCDVQFNFGSKPWHSLEILTFVWDMSLSWFSGYSHFLTVLEVYLLRDWSLIYRGVDFCFKKWFVQAFF